MELTGTFLLLVGSGSNKIRNIETLHKRTRGADSYIGAGYGKN